MLSIVIVASWPLLPKSLPVTHFGPSVLVWERTSVLKAQVLGPQTLPAAVPLKVPSKIFVGFPNWFAKMAGQFVQGVVNQAQRQVQGVKHQPTRATSMITLCQMLGQVQQQVITTTEEQVCAPLPPARRSKRLLCCRELLPPPVSLGVSGSSINTWETPSLAVATLYVIADRSSPCD